MEYAAQMSSACPTIPATASVWMGCTAKITAARNASACCRLLHALRLAPVQVQLPFNHPPT